MVFVFGFPAFSLAQGAIIGTDQEGGDSPCDCQSAEFEDCKQIARNGTSDPCAKYCCGEYEVSDFFLLLIRVSQFILGIIGALTLLFIVYGGVLLIISGGNRDSIEKGKKAITGAVIGLILVFVSYTIIHFVMNGLGYYSDGFGGEWNQVPAAQTSD